MIISFGKTQFFPKDKLNKKYQVYLAKNPYRKEIKSKIKFLLSHASNWNDFKNKANALGLIVDDKGKYTTYQLSGTS